MKKIIVILLIFITFQAVSKAKEPDFDVKSKDFSQFTRYVQTLEFNEPAPYEEIKNKNEFDDAEFELKAAEEFKKRCEAVAVELKTNEPDAEAVSEINDSRPFKIKINENQYKIEKAIKNENMIWDSSKNFKISSYFKRTLFAPFPSVINSSVLKTDNENGLNAAFGQATLHDSIGTSVLFMKEVESNYNTGAVMAYKGKRINASGGSFASSYNHASSGGLIFSTKLISQPFGSFSIGGAGGKKEENGYDKSSGGVFGEYEFKRIKFNAQIASSAYSDYKGHETGIYLIPELRLTKSLSIKTRFIKNVTQNTMQNEIVLSYSPYKSKRNLSLELNASNYGGEKAAERQRIKFSASFKI